MRKTKFCLNGLYKIICFLILFSVIFSFKTSSITVVSKVFNSNPNKNLNLTSMAKVVKTFIDSDINSTLDTYNGDLTSYVANCPLCSGKLGCTGQNVLDGTTTFSDSTYGVINIVASSKNLPCGSIVRFNHNNSEITAIVLDRGVTGTALDLLVGELSTAQRNGRKNISYNVLRFGWTRSTT